MLNDKKVGSSNGNFQSHKHNSILCITNFTTTKSLFLPFPYIAIICFVFSDIHLICGDFFSWYFCLNCLSTITSCFLLSFTLKKIFSFYSHWIFDVKWFWVEKVGERWWRKKTFKIDLSNKSEWTWERWFLLIFFLFHQINFCCLWILTRAMASKHSFLFVMSSSDHWWRQ